MRKLLVAALLAAGVATPALAQQDSGFVGPRVEGVVGWDRPKSGGERSDGVGYGIGVGYDVQAGDAVVGVEAEASRSTAKDCVRDVTVVGDRLCVKAKRDLYAGARVGAAVTPKTLLYAKAGYTNGRVGVDYEDGGSGAGDTSQGSNLDGVRVGGGVEHAIGGKSYLKTEYRYSNYENGVSRHQVMGGVGIRF